MTYRVVHYINQFFAGIGGEEKADIKPEVRESVVGPGMAFANALKGEAEIVATIICGDNYFAGNIDEVSAFVVETVKKYNADGFVAGPAFNAGRYGTACGAVSSAVAAELEIPTVTAMYKENPGAEMYKKGTYVIEAADSARGMGKAVPAMAKLLVKLLKDEKLGTPEEEGYFERGVRVNTFYAKVGAERAVDMLVKKIKGEPFKTEYKLPVFDRVDPRPAIKDMAHAKVAIVTSGGIVPFGNPDHIAASSAQNYGEYDITGVVDLKEGEYQTAHGGYDQTYANQDADRVLPVDVMRDLVKEGRIGELHETFYTTVGNGTAVANAKKFGTEMGEKLKAAGVDAVVLTSTWGTCTRCGATLVKAIEETADVPVVHMATIVPISLSVGANRIIPTVAIPYPLGNPELTPEGEKELRRHLVDKAIAALETEVTEQTVFKD